MKKIKFFALAAFAMLSTNAFAQMDLGTTGSQTIDNVTYTVTEVYATNTATKINKVTARANNFTAAALVIPETRTFNVQGTDTDGNAISKECTFNVVAIEENGFINNTSITSVSIPANVEEIGAFAFEGCENLATFTLAASSKLVSIGDGAFAYTSLATLDLTNATANPNGTADDTTDDGMVEFGWKTTATAANQTGSPFISTKASHTTNLMIKTVVLPTTCATINAGAFKDSKNLATIDLKKVKEIKANAFENCAKLTSVAIGTGVTFAAAAAAGVKIGASAFKACTALTTVELGTLIAAADIDDEAFDATAGTNTKLATFTFNEIRGAIGTTSFNLATVRTLNFQKYIKTASLIPASSFTNAFPDEEEANTINYAYEDRGDNALVNAFAQAAFDATAGVDQIITLNTVAEFEGAAYVINKVKIVGGYSSDTEICNATTKKLVKDKNNSGYYYFATYGAGVYKEILKAQKSGATVYVYQAYMDVVDDEATVYFMPVRAKAGKYVIGNGTFIVKSNQEDAVVASTGAAANSTVVSDAAGVVNDLNNTGATAYSLLKVQTDLMQGGAKDVWFFNNPATSGFGFTKFDVSKQTGGLGKNCVYMTCDATSAARLNLVWLDEAGNTTAIQTINTKAKANGAIYNLRGEKVNASYKGVVIKDGKKYIQK